MIDVKKYQMTMSTKQGLNIPVKKNQINLTEYINQNIDSFILFEITENGRIVERSKTLPTIDLDDFIKKENFLLRQIQKKKDYIDTKIPEAEKLKQEGLYSKSEAIYTVIKKAKESIEYNQAEINYLNEFRNEYLNDLINSNLSFINTAENICAELKNECEYAKSQLVEKQSKKKS